MMAFGHVVRVGVQVLGAIAAIGAVCLPLLFGERWFARRMEEPGAIRIAIENIADAVVDARDAELRDLVAQTRKAQIETNAEIAKVTARLVETTDSLANMASTIASLSATVAKIQERSLGETTRPVEIAATGNSVCGNPPVEQGCQTVEIGGIAYITLNVRKLHDRCGAPSRFYQFVNGGGVRHDFLDLGNRDGRGAQLPVAQGFEPVTVAQRIPADDGVIPGFGRAYVSVSYPDCPGVDAWTAAIAPFRIASKQEP